MNPKKPAAPAPAPVVFSLAIVPTKRLGQPEFSVAIVKNVGDKMESLTFLPDGNYERLDEALRDLQRCAVQGYRFKAWEALAAGRV